MVKEEILESNKLIAEFMGGKYNNQVNFRIAQNEIWLPIHGVTKFNTADLGSGKILEYHKSWDWLMPVVEKIESLGYTTLIKNYGDEFSNFVEILNTDEDPLQICCFTEHVMLKSKLELTYKAVIEFIKWYNEKYNK